MNNSTLGSDVLEAMKIALLDGRLTDPFALLGPHPDGDGLVVRTCQPGARAVTALQGRRKVALQEEAPGLFAGRLPKAAAYRYRIEWPDAVQETEDPYSFGLVLGDVDLHLFAEGTHWNLAERLGAVPREMDGVPGVAFSVWAPNARRVSVVGDFNAWDGRRHPMRLRYPAGIWELFVPRLAVGERYKFEIVGPDGHTLPQKADPLARRTEAPPATASVVAAPLAHVWKDEEWMRARAARQAPDAPMSIYELHPASWLRPPGEPHGILDWDRLAERLPAYAADLGFTHVELLPIMEHPFGGSWGYQPLSQFAPSARFGAPEGFARFVEACHRQGLGVILDWVPGHFPTDPHGLATFDGTALYEHADPREGFHQDWNTLIYNFGRREVEGFLIASALYWLERFHVDGLRVDAVASMLYRDYSRQPGEWTPNKYGGRENMEAIAFLKRMNAVVRERCPGAITLAEESTAWPGVTAPLQDGGLGFHYKWNMGWMHDTLQYLARDPVHRRWHHGEMTFSLVYAFSEAFVLPISHDEVVHGKGSLLGKMPGDRWRQFANLRALMAFMWSHPGKKLLFMGCELGQETEWNHDAEAPWGVLEAPEHAGVQRLVRDLNKLYASTPALHELDCEGAGFRWLVGDDAAQSVVAYLRLARSGPPVLVALNFTPEPRAGYRLGAPQGGRWRELINTDSELYGGANFGNGGGVEAKAEPWAGQPYALDVMIPPLGAVILKPEGAA